MKNASAFSSEVLPELVPPDTRMLQRPFTAALSRRKMSSLNEPRVSRSLGLSGSWRNLRIDTMGPSTDSGSITTFRRPPSGRRASTMGLDSSSRRPSGARMRRTMRNTCWLSEKRTVSRASTPRRDTNTLSLPLMRMSSTSWSLSRSSSGPRPASSLVSAAATWPSSPSLMATRRRRTKLATSISTNSWMAARVQRPNSAPSSSMRDNRCS